MPTYACMVVVWRACRGGACSTPAILEYDNTGVVCDQLLLADPNKGLPFHRLQNVADDLTTPFIFQSRRSPFPASSLLCSLPLHQQREGVVTSSFADRSSGSSDADRQLKRTSPVGTFQRLSNLSVALCGLDDGRGHQIHCIQSIGPTASAKTS